MACWRHSYRTERGEPLARILAIGIALLPLVLLAFLVRVDVAHAAITAVPVTVEAPTDQAPSCPPGHSHHGFGTAGPCCGVAHATCCWLPLVNPLREPLSAATSSCSQTDPAFASLRYAPPLPPPISAPAS